MLDFRDAISGAVGAACLTLCGAPFDTVKLRVQARLAGSPLEAARAILRHEGAAALWRGAGPAFASHAVENVVLFASQGLFRRLAAAEGWVRGRVAPGKASTLPWVLLVALSPLRHPFPF